MVFFVVQGLCEAKKQIVVDSTGVSFSRPLSRQRHIPWPEIRRVLYAPHGPGFVIEGRKRNKIKVEEFLQNIECFASILLEVVDESKYVKARKVLEKVASEKNASRRFIPPRLLTWIGTMFLLSLATQVGKLAVGSEAVVRTPTAEELRLVIRLDDFDDTGLEALGFKGECTVTHKARRRLGISYCLCSKEEEAQPLISETVVHSRESAAEAHFRELCNSYQAEIDQPVDGIDARLGKEEWPLKEIEGKAFKVLSKKRKFGNLAIARSGKAVQLSSCLVEICTLDELAALMAERLGRCQAVKP